MPKSNLSKGLASILIDFSAWTSIHGIPHIGMANSFWLRIMWTVFSVASFSMFSYLMVGIVTKYFSYPVNVGTQLEFGERVFPSVTFCNLNPWNKSSAASGPLGPLIGAYTAGTNAGAYGFSTTTYDKQKRARKWAQFYFDDMVADDATSEASYDYNDLFITCSYNTKTCNESDFSSFYDSTFGLCHTFNYDGRYSSSRAGPLYGLRAVLRTRPMEYLPWIPSAGAVVYIHNDDEYPFMDAWGYYVPVGTASSLGVRFVSREKLPEPYSKCSNDGGDKENYYNTTYQVEACVRSCLQDEIVKQCACYDPSYPEPKGNHPSCADVSNANDKVDCIFKVTDNDGLTGFDVNTQCDCPQNCLETYYRVTLSTAFYPATAYTPTECVSSDPGYTYWVGRDGCKAWYASNTLLIEVYYEQMNYQVLQESAAYTFVGVVSDTGGQVGLWLGMSVISIVEILTLAVLLMCYCLARPTDAYHPSFDDNEKLAEEQKQKKMREKAEKMYGRKNSQSSLYKHDGHDPLPPAVQDSR